jgi:hypothetical protein
MDMGKETIETANYCSMRSSLFASVDVTEFQTTEAYSSLGTTMVKYNIYRHSKVEKVKLELYNVKILLHVWNLEEILPWKR